jgi:outer membrane protein assembly factor BamB
VTVQPVVVGSTVVFGEVDGTMWGLAAEDGAVRWTTELDDALPPTFVQHFMHAPGLRRGDGIYYCYQTAPFGIRAGDGRIVWTGAPFGAADAFSHARGVVTGDSLLCAGFLGPLVKYALRSEGKAPRTVLAKRHVTADMTVQGAIWMLTRSSLVRLDRDSFNVVGAFRVPYAILPAGPSVDSGGAVIPFGYEGLARFDTATGKREWMVPIPEGPLNFALNMDRGVGQIGGLAAARGKLYAPGLDGTLRVLDLRSGQERGRAEVGVPLVSTPTLEGDRVFVADYSGAVHCFH